MSLDTFVVLANQYNNESDALADYEAVRKLYTDLEIIDTYDAAVLTRKPNGKVEIVKRTEEPTRQGGAKGFLVGLAVGAVVLFFQPPASGSLRDCSEAGPLERASARWRVTSPEA